jgi:uncharacterized membrane protein YbhN (UPF0104 family)
VIAVVLFAGAAAGLAVIPGFQLMWRTLAGVRWPWLAASFGGLAAAFAGYMLAWHGIARYGGPQLTTRQRFAAVMVGFGGFIGRGGSAIDRYVLMASGADQREAEVRIAGLDALEHVPLAAGCCAAAVALLAAGITDPPPLDFVWPWAVGPPLGAAIVLPLVARYHGQYRNSRGLRRFAGIGADGVRLTLQVAGSRRSGSLALAGMTLYWAGEMFALWAGLAAFGVRMLVPIVMLAVAIGYVLTRRAAPFGGAGFIDTFLALCLWDCGAPLAGAIAGVFTYRFFSLFLPMPFAFCSLPALRSIGGEQAAPRAGPAVAPKTSADTG